MSKHEHSILEAHRELTAHHRKYGETILYGYGLRSRVFEISDEQTYTAWGADYSPVTALNRFLLRLMPRTVDWRYAGLDPLGIPNAVPSEAWLSTAEAIGNRRSRLIRYAYGAGTWRLGGDAEWAEVSVTDLSMPVRDVTLDYMPGGLGYSRQLPVDFAPANSEQIGELKVALEGLVASVISDA